MHAKKKKIILFLPDYWIEVYDSIITEMKYSKKEYDWELTKSNLNVDFTGQDGEAYEQPLNALKKGYIPILVLPISHCAINIDKHKFTLIGPAFKTINDIYLLRTKKRNKTKTFEIGVREEELTTSNISRVIFHHQYKDRFFYSDMDIDHNHCDIVKNLHHKAIPNSKKRIEALLKNEIHAGIFMGKELNTLGIFHKKDFIICANLNRIICNIYNIKYFPRTVFAVFEKSIDSGYKKYLHEFIEEYDYFVKEKNDTEYNKIQIFHPQLTHFACETGKYSKMEDIETQIKFSSDITNDDFHSERGKWQGRKDGFSIKDYLYNEEITKVSRLNELIKNIEFIDITDCFTIGKHDEREKLIKNQLKLFKDKAAYKLNANQDTFSFQYLKNLIKALTKLNNDEKTSLVSYLENNWHEN